VDDEGYVVIVHRIKDMISIVGIRGPGRRVEQVVTGTALTRVLRAQAASRRT
jgi:hypothetical protein